MAKYSGALLLMLIAGDTLAHCQIPCGIYDDPMRVRGMLEDVTTLEKSVRQIGILAAKRARSAEEENQLVRWVMNKEEHANNIQQTVLNYFLAQRIKAGDEKYFDKLKVLHAIVVGAMKVKQSVDMDGVEELRTRVMEFARVYLSEAEATKLMR